MPEEVSTQRTEIRLAHYNIAGKNAHHEVTLFFESPWKDPLIPERKTQTYHYRTLSRNDKDTALKGCYYQVIKNLAEQLKDEIDNYKCKDKELETSSEDDLKQKLLNLQQNVQELYRYKRSSETTISGLRTSLKNAGRAVTGAITLSVICLTVLLWVLFVMDY